ncbi:MULTISPECIES: hypothetical protein [unclassified Duganella]|uniref:hypothetical protein n=1 Tax=unclassified Duganella TaxID=2636909 RepID=UPI0006F2A87B|nr:MULTISPECIES: hypothetical protein [unclassified Duganella]KQV59863.1 hypothetical protein ASD07_23945 [Duganella sp. Root336D2]KRB87339.1 hypothetical protein ASE26_08150 [Duganella sp. Root198D2]
MKQEIRAAAGLLLVLAMPAMAQGPPDGWAPAPDARLEQARGGFENGNGLLVALGVERMVEVNGVVVARNRVELADVARLANSPEASAALAPMLVQNNTNGQLIRSLTTIDLTVNALSTLKSLNLEGNLRQALSNVIVPR